MPPTDRGVPVLDAAIARRLRAAIPEAVRNLPGWLLWREEPSDDPDKPRKIPYYSTDGSRRSGTQNTPEELPKLVTFEEAVANARRLAAAEVFFHGLGFAPRPEFDLTLLDFDNKRADPMRARLHEYLVGLVPGAYRETSPSGKGSHVILRGNGLDNAKHHDIGVEVFASKGYLTMTGDASPGGALVEIPESLRVQLRWAPAIEALLPHWKEKRHFLALALSGAMLNAGHELDDVLAFVRLVAVAAGDEEVDDRLRGVRDTAAAKINGEATTGLPVLADLLGEQTAVDKIKRALGLANPLYGLHGSGSTAPPLGEEEAALVVVRADAVVKEPVDWLWPDRIAIGVLNMISGDPGLSKSVLSCELAARCTRGASWPIDATPCTAGDALVLNVEDSKEHTIVPRLEAAGADLARVDIIEGVKDKRTGKRRLMTLADVELLERYLKASTRRYRLLVCDPVSALMAGRDSHKDADVRGLLAPLADIAARYLLAVVLISHLNKAQNMKVLYRTSGSIGFAGAVRMLHALARDPQDNKRLILVPAKDNLARQQMLGLAYRLQSVDLGEGITAPRIEWEGVEVRSADDILNPPAPDREAPDREQAETWLRDRLTDGPVAVKALQAEAEAMLPCSWVTVKRAAHELRVIGGGEHKARTWELPGNGSTDQKITDHEGEDCSDACLEAKRSPPPTRDPRSDDPMIRCGDDGLTGEAGEDSTPRREYL
jgi:hypothetical protein